MPDLEDQLAALAAAIEWPAQPARAFSVERRPSVVMRRPWFRSRWALSAAAVVLIVASLLAYTPTRTAIAGWLNLHVNVKHTTVLPTPTPLPSGALGSNLGLGTQTTLADAQKTVGWQIVVPSQLGAPDAVYLLMPPDGPSQGEVTLVYGPRAGIPTSRETGVAVLITEARGSVDEQFFGKTLGPDTTIQDVTLGSYSGWWISGRPHMFVFIDSDNDPRYDTLRLATNTLVIDEEGTIIRIEANLTEAQALQLAGTLN